MSLGKKADMVNNYNDKWSLLLIVGDLDRGSEIILIRNKPLLFFFARYWFQILLSAQIIFLLAGDLVYVVCFSEDHRSEEQIESV